MTPTGTTRPRRRLVAVVAAVGVLGLLGVGLALFGGSLAGPAPPPPPSAAGVREPEPAPTTPAFGMMAWRANKLGPADFALLRASGARYYRFNLLTSTRDDGERRPPVAAVDRLIPAGVTQDIEFLPVLLRTRAQRGGPKPGQVAEPPETERERATWRSRVRFLAERYGPDGRFWRENPGLPYRPVRAWEVWNEPNLRQFWDRRKVDPREYGRLLRETRTALRGADPNARVVSAGLAARYAGARYLSTALAEAGPCSVDAIGIHPYAPTTRRAIAHLTDARRVADARGAVGVPLWTTEVGWKVGGRGYSNVPDARAQARELASFAVASDRLRNDLKLGPSFAFALRDRQNLKTGRVDSTVGLRRADDRPKPAWGVWSLAARAAPELPLPPARRCAR